MSTVAFLYKLLDGADVQWKPLKEIGEFQRGKRFVKADIVEFGAPCIHYGEIYTHYGIWTQSAKSFLDKKLAAKLRFARPGDVIIVAAGETIEDIGNGTAWLGDDCIAIHDACFSFRSPLDAKYVSYFLRTRKFKSQIEKHISSGKISSINAEGLGKAKIPIPSPNDQKKSQAIQAEIVRTLDSFAELTAELAAELAARKKQYSFYRDQLLSHPSKHVAWKPLGWVGEVRMCKRVMKNQTSDTGDIPFFKIGTFGRTPDAFISKELFEEFRANYSYPKVGDVLISASGTIGRTVIFDGREAYFQDSNIVWLENDERKVLNKYLFYFYQIAKWHVSDGGVIKRLYNDNIKKTLIAVPHPDDLQKSLEEQARIVAILDKFDTLTMSRTEGLPREIELREKQYDWYRDELFNFPRPDAEVA